MVGIEGFSPLGQKVLEGESSSRQRVGTLLNELPAWYPHALACDPMLYHVEPHLLYQRQQLGRLVEVPEFTQAAETELSV